jgi:hypothetical protein
MFQSKVARNLATTGILAASVGAYRAAAYCDPLADEVCSAECNAYWWPGGMGGSCVGLDYNAVHCNCYDEPSLYCTFANELCYGS